MLNFRSLALIIPAILSGQVALAIEPKTPEVGRYQLCLGKYEMLIVGKNTLQETKVYPNETLFKIDTATGKVWALEVMGVAGQKPTFSWRPLD